MKKLTLILALAQAAVFAQTGLLGGKTGLHQQDANTLGFFHFRVGTGGTIATDNWGYTRGAQFTDRKGRVQQLDVWDARMEKGRIDGALTGNFNFAFGLRDDLDIGVSLPIYYDHAKDYSGEAIRAHMGEGGLGDLQFYGKYRTPHLFGPDYMTTAAVVDLTIPTGWRGVGMRPRHAWFLDNEGGPTYAYTANSVMLGLTGIVSVDYTKKGVPLVWNSSLGLMLGFGDASNTLVYSTGVNWLVNDYIQPFLEFSGEMRFGNDAYPFSPITDPMVLTPGINVKIPFFNIDFAAGLDIGIGNLVDGYDKKDAMDNCKDFQIKYKGETGYRAKYCYVSQPLIAGIAKLTWTFGFDGDDDNDGVKNRKDKCPDTFPPKTRSLTVSTSARIRRRVCLWIASVARSIRTKMASMTTRICARIRRRACLSTLSVARLIRTKTVSWITRTSARIRRRVPLWIAWVARSTVTRTVCLTASTSARIRRKVSPWMLTVARSIPTRTACRITWISARIRSRANTLPGIKVNKRGCPLRRKEDLDYLKKGIQFEFGSAKLLQSSYPTLDDIIALLVKIPEVKLEVQGHTDIVGTEDYNQKLSEDRAHSVTDYFESKGIPAERLRAIGFGTRMPLADNVTDAGRAKNRRVELIPFGYYTEGDGTVAAPSDSLLQDSTLAPPKPKVAPEAKPEVKGKQKGDVQKKVKSTTSKAASKKKKDIEAKAAKAVEELDAEVKAKAAPVAEKVKNAVKKLAQ